MSVTFNWYGPQVTAAVGSAGVTGVNKAAERLLALSVPRAPIRDGILRGSAATQPASSLDAEPTAYVTYDTPYAVRQHEELDYRHTDGEAKYLERPLRENAAELTAIVAAETRRAFNG